MLKIHTRDGLTRTVRLDDTTAARDCLRRLKQQDVTGFTLAQPHRKALKCPNCRRALASCCTTCGHPLDRQPYEITTNHSLSRPEGFQRVCYHAEYVAPDPESRIRGGEIVTCFADDVCVAVLSHPGQPAARVTLKHLGKRQYNPVAG